MEIKLINGKWLLNNKPFTELTPAERELLNQFLIEAKEEFEKLDIIINVPNIDQNKVIITEPFKIKQI